MSASNGGVRFGSMPQRSGPAPGLIAGPDGGSPGIGALRMQCAMALRHLHGWLRLAIPQQPPLAAVVPALVHAVQLYHAGQDDACAAQLQSVILQLHQARALRPTLPPL